MANSTETADLEQHLRQLIHSNEPAMLNRPLAKPMVRLPPAQSVHHPQNYRNNEPNSQHMAAPFSAQNMANQHFNGLPFASNGHRPDARNSHGYNASSRFNQQNVQSSNQLHTSARPNAQHFIDTQSFDRSQSQYRPRQQFQQQLYNPQYPRSAGARELKARYLELISSQILPATEMSPTEYKEKEDFRRRLQQICLELCESHNHFPKFELQSFGSFQSGFATAGSDMDLVIVNNNSEPKSANFSLMDGELPRALEKALLDAGIGARLLSRTRVPIIKVCEHPDEVLLTELREERRNWEDLPHLEKYPHLQPDKAKDERPDRSAKLDKSKEAIPGATTADLLKLDDTAVDDLAPALESINVDAEMPEVEQEDPEANQSKQPKSKSLNFPDDTGVQSDINFYNPLALHNTRMLRCYSMCDPRVRPMVLFVKSWAKKRGINSSYHGTLSSYGYVLMVLHYLVNVAQPPVLPNLQHPWRPSPGCIPHEASVHTVDGWIVNFWENEQEIVAAARSGRLTRNQESLGSLLSGFFFYYGQQSAPALNWMQQVLSLRTPRGIITKEAKGWVKARTEEGDGKRVQYRYLFCIEDPFELEHNVARTVTHHGIVSIRDEFRRAVRILQEVSRDIEPSLGLLDSLTAEEEDNLSRRHPKHESGSTSNNRQNASKFRFISTAQSPDVQDDSSFPSLGGNSLRSGARRYHAATQDRKPTSNADKPTSTEVEQSSGAKEIAPEAKESAGTEPDKVPTSSTKNARKGGHRKKRQNLDLTR